MLKMLKNSFESAAACRYQNLLLNSPGALHMSVQGKRMRKGREKKKNNFLSCKISTIRKKKEENIITFYF